MLYKGIGGWLICGIWNSLYLLFVCYFASEYLLVFLTCEVYMAIVHPIRHRTVCTITTVWLVTALIWFIGISYILSYSLATSGLINGTCYVMSFWVTPASFTAFSTINVIVKFFGPITIYVICYVKMAIFLKGSSGKQKVSRLCYTEFV